MNSSYPSHIYEPIRREVASSYIKHELRKYLPSARDEKMWRDVDSDIDKWFEDSPFLLPVRDFWNGFYGMAVGFKLLIHLCDFVTAENVTWAKEQIDPKELTFSGFCPKEFGVPMSSMAVSESIDFYTLPTNITKRSEDSVRLEETFDKTWTRADDPIIVTQKRVGDKDQMVIYEGNARVFRAVLDAKNTVNAFVGRFSSSDREPKNYWISGSLLLELVHLTRDAWLKKDEELYLATITVLRNLLKHSESARFEMKDRLIQGNQEFKMKILVDLGLD